MTDRSALLKDISEMVAAGVADDLSSDEIASNVMVIVDTAELLANCRPSVTVAQGARDAEYERKLFAAITKIDLATAVGHIRNWTCYIDDHHRQKYADLIEAQAKLIAHLVNTRAPSHTEGSR